VPLAVPLAPLVTVSQLALLVAVQAQPLVVVTVVLAGPPSLASDALVGATPYVHDDMNSKVLEAALTPVPPGPIALTVAV
jgi:hypothetical protein